jgi:hypothetical protein
MARADHAENAGLSLLGGLLPYAEVLRQAEICEGKDWVTYGYVVEAGAISAPMRAYACMFM